MRSPRKRAPFQLPASSRRSAASDASGTASRSPQVRVVSSSWITTTSPVAHRQASSSTPSAPSASARVKAARVFSGALGRGAPVAEDQRPVGAAGRGDEGEGHGVGARSWRLAPARARDYATAPRATGVATMGGSEPWAWVNWSSS